MSDPFEKILVEEPKLERLASSLNGLVQIERTDYTIRPTKKFYDSNENVQVAAYLLTTVAVNALSKDVLRSETICKDNRIIGDYIAQNKEQIQREIDGLVYTKNGCIEVSDTTKMIDWLMKNR